MLADTLFPSDDFIGIIYWISNGSQVKAVKRVKGCVKMKSIVPISKEDISSVLR